MLNVDDWLRGLGLAQYAELFQANDIDGEMLGRLTGDIVAVDPQGFITILGRAKRFAKIGGEMVSLGAVEDFVHRLRPDARHAVVAVPDPRKGERIVLVTTDQSVERDALLKAARDGCVHELMRPAEILYKTELPLLGAGNPTTPACRDRDRVLGGGVM